MCCREEVVVVGEKMILLIFLSWLCSQVRGSSLEGNRNLEKALTRLNSRLDTIVLRMDHLDNRLGNLQSLVSTRLDSIENSLATTKLRLDMMNEEVTRVDENLNRKWKNFESKIEASVGLLDSKYESKLNLILREGRRFGESVHNLFSGVERRVGILVGQVNSSLIQFGEMSNTSFKAAAEAVAAAGISTAHSSSSSSSSSLFSSSTVSTTAQPTITNLINNKVTNMFDDLIERSVKIESILTGMNHYLQDSLSITNATRREVQDSFRSLVAIRGRTLPSHSESVSASEATSMAILETLASTESMSTTISRRLNDLTRSIEQRFELVSMTLNGFFESCSRIQEGAPLIEENIANLLEKILDSFENSTKAVECKRLFQKLEAIEMKCEESEPETEIGSWTSAASSSAASSSASSSSTNNNNSSRSSSSSSSNNNSNFGDIVRNTEHLGEEDKKFLWESLFPHLNSSYVPE